MKKTLALAALLAAASFATPQVIAGETTDPAKQTTTESKKPTGAPSDQKPGTETSDRTPEEMTPTPDTQVDKSKTGETSDRTPEKMTTESQEPAGAPSGQTPGTETSDRTPEKTTPTPDTQVDKSETGETSDRTPEKK